MTILDKALILSYFHSDQLIKCLETALVEMKDVNDPRAGKFQSCLEKLQGASKRAFLNVERNIDNKEQLQDELWEVLDKNWDLL